MRFLFGRVYLKLNVWKVSYLLAVLYLTFTNIEKAEACSYIKYAPV